MATKQSPAVDWSALAHARGAAQDVPEILEGLCSTEAERRAEALQEAWARLWSGKRWYSAQPPFVEVLFDLAADPDVADRHKLLGLAANILTQGTGDKVPHGLDLHDAGVAEKYREGAGAEILRVFVERLPFLVGLLGHEDASLRAAAVECLSFVPEAPAVALDPLVLAIARERDESVIATMLHGLGIMIRYSGRAELRAVLDTHAAGGPLVARACAHTGTMSFDPSVYTPAVRDLFVDAIALPDQPADRFPFKGGKLDQMLSECVFADAGGKGPLKDLQLAAIRSGRAPDDTLSRLANDVFSYAFRRGSFTTRDQLTDEQIAILDLLSQREIAARFHFIGVPERLRVRRRWLELDPPGPLNWPVDVPTTDGVRRSSLWKALILAEEEVDARADLLRTRFSAAQLLEIYSDQALLEREPEFTRTLSQGFEANGDALLVESLAQARASALPWAIRTTDSLLDQPEAVDRMNNASLVPIVRSLGAGQMLDARYDAAVKPNVPWWGGHGALLDLLREVLERIPLDRREAIFLRVAARPRHGELSLRASFALCPTPLLTAATLEAMDGKVHPEDAEWLDEDDARAMLAAMVSTAREHPEVAAVLRSYAPVSDLLKAELPRALADLPA